jgi:hypothetical protein
LLLFGLAIALNLHFQRLTYSCRLLEERIERLIASLMGRQPHAGVIRDTAAEQATGYEFRRELGDIYNRVHWPHFDLMARLLILGVILFCSYAFFVATAPCDRKWYWTAAILFGPAIIGYILVRLWNWWKD